MANKGNIDDTYTFTLRDFSKFKQGISQVFGPESMDDNGNIISFIDQAALITHYLNLENKRNVRLSYSLKSQKLLDLWCGILTNKFIQDSYQNCSCESNLAVQQYLFPEIFNVPFPSLETSSFNFIDLFAGIGGFRLAMQKCGGQCIFSSEIDENARKTYYKNFGEVPFGDITNEFVKSCIPDNVDVICAGFPCQAFSIAGYRKGFEDTRGTLFFDVAEIIKRKQPKAVFLENVKNLRSHDNGKTFEVIKNTLEDLGYIVYYKVMNAMDYANIPQNRERIFIVCFNPSLVPNYYKFKFPEKEELTRTIHDCIDHGNEETSLFYGNTMKHYDELRKNIVSYDTVYQWRRQYVRENKSQVCPTLTANMGTGGHNVPLILTKKGIRKLSPKECLNFQGFPKEYEFPSSISNASKYKQAGNSVVVPLITKVCKEIVSLL